MSFTDNLKRSLGFEETESSGKKEGEGFNFSQFLNDVKTGVNRSLNGNNPKPQNNPQPEQYRPKPRTVPNPQANPTPVYDDFDDFVITPEQPFYEIVLIRPKTIDDVNYVVDQVIEEKNPVILDLSFLQKESPANFKLAGDKIKQMRARYDAQALLLARTEEKNLIIISPKKVKVVNKG
ncbi:cell division protein SepF [Methanobrevibacter sp.]|uniref:cell division protein SepF n=1 Tax=Methanobrevibacter sp. TaxID=66852 RepID=UPI00388F2A6E